MKRKLEYHPLANKFPMLSQSEIEELAADIKTEGQQFPIILHEGKILDGRNRYEACMVARVEPRTEYWHNLPESRHTTPEKWVISTNLHRRHLTDSQRAMIAASIVTSQVGAPDKSKEQVTEANAAELLHVTPANVSRARVIEKKGSEALKDAVKEGRIGVAPAAMLAKKLGKGDQSKVVAKSVEEIKAIAKKLANSNTGRKQGGLDGENLADEEVEADADQPQREILVKSTNQIREAEFYKPFKDWLKKKENCSKAAELGGNLFKDKWGTPDVLGIIEPRRGDMVQFPTEIVAAEIKLDISSQLITAFGQACAYYFFAHQSYLVIPKSALDKDIERITAMCRSFGIGLVLFDDKHPQAPDFKMEVYASRHEPDKHYLTKYMKLIQDWDDRFS